VTVAEVIAALQRLPPEMPVTVTVSDDDRGGTITGYLSRVTVDDHTYTGRFDPQTRRGVYETAVCLAADD
jgi:hypothetical protein